MFHRLVSPDSNLNGKLTFFLSFDDNSYFYFFFSFFKNIFKNNYMKLKN